MARVPRAPRVQQTSRPARTGTPAGMAGVRPGSAAAVAAGYRPPRPSRPQRRPGGAPMSVTFNADGTTSLAAPSGAAAATTNVAPPPPPAAATIPSGWWAEQFRQNPTYQTQAGILAGRENQIGATYGYTVRRAPSGQAYYRLPETSAGGGNITSSIDDAGNLVYKDEAGNAVAPERIKDLVLDIVEVGATEPSYREGALGRARMESAGRQFGIGDVAARSGVRRSGMRAGASLGESRALVDALTGLSRRAMGEFAGVNQDYIDLYNRIYSDLAEKAANLVPPAAETPAAPAETPAAPAAPTGQAPVAGGGAVNPAGQYTPPAAGSALSDRAFDNSLNEILGPPSQRGPQPLTKGDRIRGLRNLLDNYPLSPAQRSRVVRELKALGFVVR